MGKSHRSKKLKIHEEDLRREREEREAKEKKAQKRVEAAARKMEVTKSASARFLKATKHGKSERLGVSHISKRAGGVRKPSYIMKKQIKKMAKAREMDEG